TYKLYRDGRFFNTINDTSEIFPLEKMTETELILKEEFQLILNEKENEIPFALNDTIFNLAN
ncbi:MAG: hypothetical protein HOG79_11295, partial [Prolixibacteraceae bacterium]|nr:hypothetical protein [Prolixibacteraceae bacterium]